MSFLEIRITPLYLSMMVKTVFFQWAYNATDVAHIDKNIIF